ncbi:hypothetical protein LPJ71_004536, partial [Coemansia sp. S17]
SATTRRISSRTESTFPRSLCSRACTLASSGWRAVTLRWFALVSTKSSSSVIGLARPFSLLRVARLLMTALKVMWQWYATTFCRPATLFLSMVRTLLQTTRKSKKNRRRHCHRHQLIQSRPRLLQRQNLLLCL